MSQSIYRLSILTDVRSTDIPELQAVHKSITLSIDQVERERNIIHEDGNSCETTFFVIQLTQNYEQKKY